MLIANRGEIACRIIRSCKALGLETIAVHSEADAGALHVELADGAEPIGPAPARQSYLDMDAVIAAAKAAEVDAIHPGYGFLAENPRFAERVEAEGLVWIGPRPKTIEDMGDKERARLLAKAAGLPVLPGSPRFAPEDLSGLEDEAVRVGYPLLVKAAAGGGGIGMQRVEEPEKLRGVVESTQGMAARAFGDGTVYLERFIPKARHVEIQIFGLGDGRAVHLFERDCSIQRRYQKIIEETPAPGLSDTTRRAMSEAATALAAQERYRGAGTIEFVVDATTKEFFFLEMNTRIQVEHPVTEMTTGHDLVALQIRLARGDDLSELTQDGIRQRGHAIECRIYAENPARMFLPSPGPLDVFRLPEPGAEVRVDTGVREGDRITPHYDPLIAKLICRGADREEATLRSLAALRASAIAGIHSNLRFLIEVLQHPAFRAGDVHTGFVEAHRSELFAT
ncbi:MAG TPA: biotin carboxylase N-terminal domain-containing protein [Geminicoccaceae bacterium]|nr:biotin carboxylase N-terminal domain-containing protein [Geminicoccaceae bacterium]